MLNKPKSKRSLKRNDHKYLTFIDNKHFSLFNLNLTFYQSIPLFNQNSSIQNRIFDIGFKGYKALADIVPTYKIIMVEKYKS